MEQDAHRSSACIQQAFFVVGAPCHRRDQDQINNLPNKQEPPCEEPDESGDPLAVVETVDPAEPNKAETPEQI